MLSPTDIVDRIFLVEDTPAARRKWRLTISLSILMLVGHMLWACGLMPGIDGFALASDQKRMKDDLVGMRLQLLDKDILDMREQQCKQPQKGLFTRRLQDLQTQWLNLTNTPYIMPRCDEL